MSTEAPGNPFRFGRTVVAEHFCNRREELAHVAASIRSGNSLLLHSPRRYGKTSLIQEAFALVAGELETAFVDLYGITDEHDFVEAWMRGISPLLGRLAGAGRRALGLLRDALGSLAPQMSLGRDGAPVFSVSARPHRFEADRSLAELLSLPEVVAERAGARAVVALDEFQEVGGIPGLDRRLRSVFQHQRLVGYVFSGSRRSLLATLFDSPEAPFFESAEQLAVRRIAPDELLAYVEGRFATRGSRLPDGLAKDLVEAAEGHPHYTQLFAAHAWEVLRGGGVPDVEVPRVWRGRVVRGLDASFSAFFDGLALAQKRVLRHVGVEGGEGLFSQRVREAHRLGSSSTVAGAVAALVDREVLLKPAAGPYHLANPALGLWLRARFGAR